MKSAKVIRLVMGALCAAAIGGIIWARSMGDRYMVSRMSALFAVAFVFILAPGRLSQSMQADSTAFHESRRFRYEVVGVCVVIGGVLFFGLLVLIAPDAMRQILRPLFIHK